MTNNRHLTPSELVDILDEELAPARRAHVNACAECQGRVNELQMTLRDVQSIDAPEPSPLFWDHLSDRIQQAITAEPAPREAWWHQSFLGRPWLALTSAASAAVLVLAVVLWQSVPARYVESQQGSTSTAATETVANTIGSAATDPEWSLVVTAAEEFDWDTVVEAGFTVRPGAAENAVLQLTADEQRELERLIKAEMAREKS